MEPERGGASGEGEGFYPAVSPDLVRSGAAAFSQHQPAAEFAPVSLGHQETFLRASHYTVVTSDGAVVHHVSAAIAAAVAAFWGMAEVAYGSRIYLIFFCSIPTKRCITC